ncbi:MAG: MBL fold metallo-hydrolase, partial [Cyclobacteriaceae bacterium]|nr:MBL fold metallo-hydrolase [Cyclobacteriaceae bacterium]
MVKKIANGILIFIFLFALTVYIFMQQQSFGKLPEGARKQKIEESPNYKNGSFQNRIKTPMMAPDVSYFSMIRKFLSDKPETYPHSKIPSVQTDLKTFTSEKPSIIWFGHSSYLISIDNKRILVDPVFSQRPSPVQYAGSKAFTGAMV